MNGLFLDHLANKIAEHAYVRLIEDLKKDVYRNDFSFRVQKCSYCKLPFNAEFPRSSCFSCNGRWCGREYYCKMPENLRGVFNSDLTEPDPKYCRMPRDCLYCANVCSIEGCDRKGCSAYAHCDDENCSLTKCYVCKKVVCILNHVGEAVKKNYGYDEPISYYCEECDPPTD